MDDDSNYSYSCMTSSSLIRVMSCIDMPDTPLIDASSLYLYRLEGVEDPEQKRKIIGNMFVSSAVPLNSHLLSSLEKMTVRFNSRWGGYKSNFRKQKKKSRIQNDLGKIWNISLDNLNRIASLPKSSWTRFWRTEKCSHLSAYFSWQRVKVPLRFIYL